MSHEISNLQSVRMYSTSFVFGAGRVLIIGIRQLGRRGCEHHHVHAGSDCAFQCCNVCIAEGFCLFGIETIWT